MKNLLLLIFILIISCDTHKEENVLLIATAANMQFAMKELAEEYSSTSGIKCELIVSSSGKLTAQILEGAPYDLFVSADMKYPQTLYDEGFCIDKPQVYGYGKLVLWTMNTDISAAIDSMDFSTIEHIAMANPQSAPYGKAAKEALEHYGLYEELKNKLVFGESIAQTNQFIISQAAGLGFTAKSVVLASGMKDQGYWADVDAQSYTPIDQGIVIINSGSVIRTEQAKAFLSFLLSERGKKILQSYGYGSIP